MNLTRYPSDAALSSVRSGQAAADFLFQVQTALEREEAANGLIIGIAGRLRESPERIKIPPYLATVSDGDELLAAAVMTPPQRLLLWSSDDRSEPLRLLVTDLIAGSWSVPGVNALKSTAHAFAETWTALTGQTRRPGMNERIYTLHRVIPPEPPVSGRLRVALERDVRLAEAWMWSFIQDAGVIGTPENAREGAAARIEDRDLFFWEDAGRPVSMAAKTRKTTHGIAVSWVYTPPEFRRRGYASACVAALSQQLLDAGWQFCALFTDLANPTSNSIYQKIGYRPVADFDEWHFA